MDFSYTAKEEAFRNELRTWLQDNLPEGWLDGTFEYPEEENERAAFLRDWQRKLSEGRWAGISWPEQYGGRGATLVEEVIFEQEMAKVKAPPIINTIGTAMVGPTLLQIGTDYQKETYVPKILNGDEIWCQGYSEPSAGSDLAAIQTRAVKQGDKWIINGQKVWTSFAHLADKCFLLARTENTGKKHEGITAFLIDMHQPGVEVRPIHQINDAYDFNEVFLNDAVAYEADVVGEVGDGWRVGLILLSHERVGVAKQTFRLQKLFDELADMAKTLEKNGRPLIEDQIVRQKLVGFRAKTRALLLNYYRHLTDTIRNGRPGPEGSLDKLASSELGQQMLAFGVSIQGANGQLWKEDAPVNANWQKDWLRSFAYTIEGGTSEIQRNIVGERILKLPKDIKH
ncbi:acyl-CoA dehydrogenase family protein [Bacillus dakarensis]|uniref:acyl-CoA dehydrogenase family protein n=1 Tax=Robertmurraya dakarensis TaxID=1926278 RepID=UPI000982316D|nr:acyl-CoA dehydrogenase family protein [Bacillus dakarensis]